MICYFLLLYNKTTSNHHFFLKSKPITGTSIQINLPQWECVLRNCYDFSKYKIPAVEYNESTHSPKINFHTYEVFTIFSKHSII